MKKEKGKTKSKKAWRISIFLASILSPFFILLSPCSACTGFYVGRKVSADGTTMIGRTVDAAPWNGPMREVRFERGEREYADGSTNEYAFICAGKVTSQGVGFYGGGAINEKGVMISATVTGRTSDEAKEADPFVSYEDGGYGEANLPDYMIGRAATAREAVKILGAKIAARGHSGPEIYMVADTNEAWYIEVYTGHQWAAVKMPENQVAVFGNQFNIRGFCTNDTLNVMYSPNLVELARDYEFDVWEDESHGIIDLYKTYSPELIDYSNYRTFWGHNAWAPTAFPKDTYETSILYPLFFKPEEGKKISLTDVFELMRTRYEGVNCPDENTNTSIRVIGTTKQQSCHVLQMRHDLPAGYCCTLWECLAQAEHSTFLPVCMAVKMIPETYSRDQTGTLEYDSDRAADAFLRLDTLAETKRFVVDTYGNRRDVRLYYGAGVRAYWKAQEDRLVAEWPQLLAQWSAAEAEAGRAAATAYANFNQVWTLSDAKRLHDELAWYWAEFNCDLRDGGGATDVPTYPFASSVPANAETGGAWTRWHREEFAAYVEELAGAPEMRLPSVAGLINDAKHALDGVEDAATLSLAKTQLQGIVGSISEEITKPFEVPIIVSFGPDFPQGSTSEVPTVSWKIQGPYDQVTVTIDGKMAYDGDSREGEVRWKDELCRPGVHRLGLTVRINDEEVSSSCFYTSLIEDEDPVLLPRIDYFYPETYVGQVGVVPTARWSTQNITSLEIWVDGQCIHVSEDARGNIRLSQLRRAGSHIVHMVAHNVIGDMESSFAYKTESASTDQLRSAPFSPLSAPLEPPFDDWSPIIRLFKPDAYDASIWETPYIHWELDLLADSVQLKIDDTVVFTGDGRVGSGRWLDLSRLNLDASNGVHEVTLTARDEYGVTTSNFTYTCHWAEPPPPPQGGEDNPWTIGDDVQAYTNGSGGLIITGEGATSNFTAAAEVPWAEVAGEIESVTVPDAVTVIGDDLWAGLEESVVINGETIVRRKGIAAGFPAEDPSGAISGAEFERVEIANGKMYLGVSVATNVDLTAATEVWRQADIEEVRKESDGTVTLTVPAPAEKGFMILRSKAAVSDVGVWLRENPDVQGDEEFYGPHMK